MKPLSVLIDEEKDKIDSLRCCDIIKSLGIDLRARGSRYVAMCPLHNDVNGASLIVYPNTNSWCCFSTKCGGRQGHRNGGDGIEFVMQYKKCSYSEAVHFLSDHFDLVVESASRLEDVSQATESPVTIERVDIDYFHSLLDVSEQRGYFHNRGFEDKTIDREMFGFDGRAHIIPIWAGEPRNSNVLSIKRRLIDDDAYARYIRVGDYKESIYGMWYCRSARIIYGFAGELDCALANQYNLPSFSLINGVGGWLRLQKTWAHDYFPHAERLIVVFDRGEEQEAGSFASDWERQKGRFTSEIINYPSEFLRKDFNEFVLDLGINKFLNILAPVWA